MKTLTLALILSVVATAVGCADPAPAPNLQKTQSSLVSFRAGPQTEKALGVSKWRVRMVDGATVLDGLDKSGKSVGHVTLENATSATATNSKSALWFRAGAKKGRIVVRADKTVISNSMPTTVGAWAASAKRDLAVFRKKGKAPNACAAAALDNMSPVLDASKVCSKTTSKDAQEVCAALQLVAPLATAKASSDKCEGITGSKAAKKKKTTTGTKKTTTGKKKTGDTKDTGTKGQDGSETDADDDVDDDVDDDMDDDMDDDDMDDDIDDEDPADDDFDNDVDDELDNDDDDSDIDDADWDTGDEGGGDEGGDYGGDEGGGDDYGGDEGGGGEE
jgi:hypothetical protein